MAYMCKRAGNRECDGCGDCQPKETGVVVTARLEMKFTIYGEIETLMRSGRLDKALREAEAMVEDELQCAGITGTSVEEVEIKLND